MNKLELINTTEGWIAVFTGTTGKGEVVKEEEAHGISGDNIHDRIEDACIVWGINLDDEKTNLVIHFSN